LKEILAETELFVQAEKMLLAITDGQDPIQAIIDLDVVFLDRVVGVALKIKEKEEDYEYCHHLLTSIALLYKTRDAIIDSRLVAVG